MNPPLTRRNWLGLTGAACAAGAVALQRVFAATRSVETAERAAEAHRLIEGEVQRGVVSAAAFLVRQDKFEFIRAYGKAKIDTPFLIASPTKPMTASAVMRLRDQGRLELSDSVQKFLPAFKGEERAHVTLKHLLTHTSGLPDMLPENVELRRRHAALPEFVEAGMSNAAAVSCGEKVSYQSMGILLAAAVVEKVSGLGVAEFLGKNIFAPLGMKQTSLGLGGRSISATAECQVPETNDWDWNSPYWRNLGAPWGGAHSTVRDLATFAEAFTGEDSVPWPPATRKEMREVQTGALRPAYGFGWMREPGAFGKTCSLETFGHFGSTGTVVWHDPRSRITCVVLTTRPAEQSRASVLIPVSEIVGRGELMVPEILRPCR